MILTALEKQAIKDALSIIAMGLLRNIPKGSYISHFRTYK